MLQTIPYVGRQQCLLSYALFYYCIAVASLDMILPNLGIYVVGVKSLHQTLALYCITMLPQST